MRLTRQNQLRVAFVLNDLLPPALRDSRRCMAPLMRMVFGNEAEMVMSFKERVGSMSHDEFVDVYRRVAASSLTSGTDLNPPCMERILNELVGSKVLEVGCGEGALAMAMSEKVEVTACDILVRPELVADHPTITFREADVEALPFDDGEFDTVVCTHTLEHVRDVRTAMDELRRVARSRVIVVVPKERPYRYTFNLHIHFFPYKYTLREALGARNGGTQVSESVGGDWYHREDA
jgi:ubiquinone/menaquinone biosynthesis C-methylase UbiE